MAAADPNSEYARYMIERIAALDTPDLPLSRSALAALRAYWYADTPQDLASLREQLWAWVDEHGGPRITLDKDMLFVRMVLCLAFEDNRELEDMGFFEDLIQAWGAATVAAFASSRSGT